MLHLCGYGFLNSKALQQKGTESGNKNNKNHGTMCIRETIRPGVLPGIGGGGRIAEERHRRDL